MFGRESNVLLSLITSVSLNKLEYTAYASQLPANLKENYDWV